MKRQDIDRIAYNRKLENLSLEKSLVRSAKIEGLEEGKNIGEKKAKIEIAKISLKQNININTISMIRGLTIEEIENL